MGASFVACAWAQPGAATESPLATLPTIVVTASRFEQELGDALPFTTVITREAIENSQQPDLVSVLQREAGVQFARSGGRGAATSIFLRGTSSRQVLVLVDGVPINKQDAFGAIALEHIMLDAVERIEVVRGNVSALYGSAAIGGVVQIFTRRGGESPGASVELEAGSQGSWRTSASAHGRYGPNALAAGVSVQGTDGASSQDPARVLNVNPDRDGYRNRSAWASLQHTLAPEQTLSLRLQHSDGRYDYDVGGSFADPADTHEGRNRLRTIALTADNRYAAGWRGVLTLSEARDVQTNAVRGSFAYDNRFLSRTRVLNWTNHVDLAPDWRATAGVERQWQAADVDDGFGGLYDRKREADAVYAGISGHVGSQSLQFNLRRDDVSGVGGQTTGLLGWGWELTERWKLVATASTAFNVAPLGYLHAPFFGNPALRPERARSVEAGVQWQDARSWWRATAFRSRIRDEFEYSFTSFRFENLTRTRNQGVELAGSTRLERVDLRASLTLQDPRDVDTDTRRLRRARHFGSLGLTWPLGDTSLSADWRYSASRPDTGAQRLPSYHVLDLAVRHAVSPELSLLARVDNALDRRYETVYGYPQPRRGLFVGLQWRPSR